MTEIYQLFKFQTVSVYRQHFNVELHQIRYTDRRWYGVNSYLVR